MSYEFLQILLLGIFDEKSEEKSFQENKEKKTQVDVQKRRAKKKQN
jgi:hypothetical protein